MKKPSNQEFKEVFDKVATKYNDVCNPFLVYERKTILGNWARGKCLEVGAGTGEISKFISLKHPVVATDIAPGMVREIKKRGIEAYVCDAERLPFEDRSFDSVLSAEVLYYLDNPNRFLSESFRVLRPGGRLLISCANNLTVKFYDKARAFLRAVGVTKGMYFDEDAVQEFMTAPKLRTMLSRNGFDIIEEKKAPVLPFRSLNFLNQMLEKTPLRHLGVFIFVFAQKRG